MNIAIGKIGQKLIFDRNSQDALRSSTNGHASVWAFYRLMIEQCPENTYIFAGDYDILPSNNCTTLKDTSIIDVGIFFVGINDDVKLINFINNSTFPYVLIVDDIRCLNALNKNTRLKRLPLVIFNQNDLVYMFHDKKYFLQYLPFETAQCYKYKHQPYLKTTNMTILANVSEVYNRLSIVKQYTYTHPEIAVYGRLDKHIYPYNFKGEVDYQIALNKLARSKMTFLVPVMKGTVTTKYIEALMNDCIPLFYKTYGTSYLKSKLVEKMIVNTQEDFDNLYYTLSNNETLRANVLNKLQEDLLSPWMSGKKLSDIIMEELSYVEAMRTNL